MVVIECPITGCGYSTDDASEAIAIATLNIHALSHQSHATRPSGPKLERPRIDIGIETETWNNFTRRWDTFYHGSNIDDRSAPRQLLQCASDSLCDMMLKSDPDIATKTLAEVMASMKSFAVIPIATSVLRAELMQLNQAADEQFRPFAARVRGKAETCSFTTKSKCTCKKDVITDYTDEMIRDVLLAGIADIDIRREALGTKDILQLGINDIISLVEGKEMARNALPSASSLSAMSSFKRASRTPPCDNRLATTSQPSNVDRSRQGPCPDCGKIYSLYSNNGKGWNTKPHRQCLDCYRTHRQRFRGRRTPLAPAESNSLTATAPVAQISTLASSAETQRACQPHRPGQSQAAVLMEHQIFNKGEWRRTRFKEHPRVTVTVTVDNVANKAPTMACEVSAVADSGAQSNLWSLAHFLSAGFSQSDLIPVKMGVNAANCSPISIDGAFHARLVGRAPNGTEVTARGLIYVSRDVSDCFLSYDTMLDLEIIPRNFPTIGDARKDAPSPDTRSLNAGCSAVQNDTGPCSCPQCTGVPPRPASLPFPCTPENGDKMKTWLVDYFASSTFNTCPHRPLLCMAGPPLEMHVDDKATPRACHTPAPVPLHWQQRVHDDLLRDEALGVIEKVPYGDEGEWCHRMVVTRKHDGSPRRTVDLSPLNKFCKREAYPSESPSHIARRVPGHAWKTVVDAWNGYHAVPLRESDRHLTTFITPFGKWRYARAPQGFLSSGDGYNRHFDAILSDMERKDRCVDDLIYYDDDLEAHWWRTIDLLRLLGTSGIVLNPDKFQFASKIVDFAGFRISEDTIEPLPKYLDAIRHFPTPTSTTDIRSWFGLVNQVTNYAQLRDVMEPFRPFLSPKRPFCWGPELHAAFTKSKDIIIEAIRHGVEIFDPSRPTCLRPDWSTRGIGYFLLQKHCTCSSELPDCCDGGWRITLAGSRFLLSSEERYAPIEGEALAVAWGLEQSRYFTQGCENLLVVTDHKPLVKILGDRTLDEITNTRLFRLKQRTLPWFFKIAHLPGRTNFAADATSRHPAQSCDTSSAELSCIGATDLFESEIATVIRREMEVLSTISWEEIQTETARDLSMNALRHTIESGMQHIDRSQPHVAPFWQFRDGLYVSEGVIMYDDRVVVPPSLRQSVLSNLHAAHQGTSAMELRARTIVFWPGITADIHRTRAGCDTCNKNAPSQASTPSTPANPPSTPFEEVFADFFDFGGHHYLVVGDRLSGWVEIFSTPTGTSKAGALGLIACLRSFFATFGVPQELASDGGPEFTADATSDFLTRWGVIHRISAAHHPQSNGRAEVAVKTAKRLMRSNVTPTGALDNDRLLRALLQLRNTPDPDCCISPAEIVFGRQLRDAFSFVNRLEKFSNPSVRLEWREAWRSKEIALRARFVKSSERLNEHSRPLPPLKAGDRCFVQNQTGRSPGRWDRTGTVVEALGHDKYHVKVDGSGRLTMRNRKFLRSFIPASTEITRTPPPTAAHDPPGMHAIDPPLPAQLVAPTTPSKAPPLASPPMILNTPPPLPAPPQEIPEVDVESDPAPSPAPYRNAEDTREPTPTDMGIPPSTPIRSRRMVRAPRTYEPESGKWI